MLAKTNASQPSTDEGKSAFAACFCSCCSCCFSRLKEWARSSQLPQSLRMPPYSGLILFLQFLVSLLQSKTTGIPGTRKQKCGEVQRSCERPLNVGPRMYQLLTSYLVIAKHRPVRLALNGLSVLWQILQERTRFSRHLPKNYELPEPEQLAVLRLGGLLPRLDTLGVGKAQRI